MSCIRGQLLQACPQLPSVVDTWALICIRNLLNTRVRWWLARTGPYNHSFQDKHQKAQSFKEDPSVLQEIICISFLRTQNVSRPKLQPSSSYAVGSGRCQKSSHHQKKFKGLFRNHAHFYSMLREVLDTEDKEMERKVNCVEETQMVCFLLEEITNPPTTPCLAKPP